MNDIRRYLDILIESEDMQFPLRRVTKAYHIGSLDAGDKARDPQGRPTSYEGEGVSITNRPDAWLRIARLGGKPWWLCENPTGTFLDNKKLTADHRRIMAEWATAQGMTVSDNERGAIAVAYAEEVLGIDGVWWTVATSTWHAPRGVIVPRKVKSWTFTKIRDE